MPAKRYKVVVVACHDSQMHVLRLTATQAKFLQQLEELFEDKEKHYERKELLKGHCGCVPRFLVEPV